MNLPVEPEEIERPSTRDRDVPADQEFHLISSLSHGMFVDDVRYADEPLLYHQERLLAAAHTFGWLQAVESLSGAQGLDRLRDAITRRQPTNDRTPQRSVTTDPEKVRLIVASDGTIHAESSVIGSETCPTSFAPARLTTTRRSDADPNHNQPCQIYLDTTPTTPSLFTTHKTTMRLAYDEARRRAGISALSPTQAEVLLYNPRHEVMEASLSTPYFFRAGRWVTPALSCGGNAGVSRRVALTKGLCEEDVVGVGELRDGEVVFVSNGVRGFVQGVLRLRHSTG